MSQTHRYRGQTGSIVAIRKEMIGMIALTMILIAVAAYIIAIDLEAYPRATRRPRSRT